MFGGPLLDDSTGKWIETHFTEQGISATGYLQGASYGQSEVWVSPRMFISTLHMRDWALEKSNDEE